MAMNPLQILANIGLTLADLALSTEALKALERAGAGWTNWTQAQGLARALGFPAGPAGAIKAFNIGRLLGRQEMWLPAIADIAALPRAMTQVATPTEWSAEQGARYRYDVIIEVTFGGRGGEEDKGVHIDSDVPLSRDEVLDRAVRALRGDLIGHSPRLLGDGGPTFTMGEPEIVAVFRYI